MSLREVKRLQYPLPKPPGDMWTSGDIGDLNPPNVRPKLKRGELQPEAQRSPLAALIRALHPRWAWPHSGLERLAFAISGVSESVVHIGVCKCFHKAAIRGNAYGSPGDTKPCESSE